MCRKYHSATNLFVIYSLSASTMCTTFSKSTWYQIVFIGLAILFAIHSKKLKLDKFVVGSVAVYTVMCVIYFFDFNYLKPASIKFLFYLLSIYFMLKITGVEFFIVYEKIIYRLAVISLIFYFFQMFFWDDLVKVLQPFNIADKSIRTYQGIHVGIFTLIPWHFYRNCGFMWEPGAFGAMLSLAMIWNVILNKNKINKKLIIFIITGITTVSTTTIINIMLITLSLVLKANFKHKLWAIPLLIIVGIQVYFQPVIKDKLNYYYTVNMQDYYKTYSSDYWKAGTSIGRFAGLVIEFENFKKKPLLGWGYQSDYMDQGMFDDFSNPNGLSVLLGRFGLVGMLFFLGSLYLGLKKLQKYQHYKGEWVFFIIVIFISSSNPMIYNIFIWSMVLLYYVLIYSPDIKDQLMDYLN